MRIINLLVALALIWASNVAANPAGLSLAQCHGVKDLVFVAHMDDDLLFMNPDIASTVTSQGCTKIVYLTASDRGEGTGYMLGRERGVQAAYAELANTPNLWTETVSSYGTRRLAHFSLNGNPRITLVQMRLQDPWLGKGWGSLTPLSQAESVPGQTAASLGPHHESYTRAAMVATLAAIIQKERPTTIRYMDATINIAYNALCWRCSGHDHPDHIASARLVRDAMQIAGGNYAKISYLSYPSQERAANLSHTEAQHKTQTFLTYTRHDYRYCPTPSDCQGPAGPEASWVNRIYYVSTSDSPAILLSMASQGYSLFAVGEHNRAANIWDSSTQQWSSLGGRTADVIAAFARDKAGISLFMRSANGQLWVKTRNQENTWHPWKLLSGAHLTHFPSVTAQDQPAAIAMGNDGHFHSIHATTQNNNWSAWRTLPLLPNALPIPAIVYNNTGHLQAFAADTQGGLWASTLSPEPGWSAWENIALVETNGGLAAIRNQAGYIQLYLRDQASGHMVNITQQGLDTAHNQWSPPTDLGLAYTGQPAIGMDKDGAVVVAAQERPQGSIWLNQDGKTVKLAGAVASAPTLNLIDGVLHMVARSNTVQQDYRVMKRTRGVWTTLPPVMKIPTDGGGAFE